MANLRQYADGNFLPIIQHEIVEVIIPANSTLTRIQFPDIQNLRDSNLVAIEYYAGLASKYEDTETLRNPSFALLNSELVTKTPTGRNLVPTDWAKGCFLTLQSYNGVEFLHQSPVMSHRYVNGFSRTDVGQTYTSENFQKQFSAQKCNWPKCYLERFITPTATEDLSFLFSVYYYKTNEIQGLMGAEFRKQS